ncbi:MAG: hypothetical protein ACREQ5_35560, partial [Candidatus Dormibacteria bacterium]
MKNIEPVEPETRYALTEPDSTTEFAAYAEQRDAAFSLPFVANTQLAEQAVPFTILGTFRRMVPSLNHPEVEVECVNYIIRLEATFTKQLTDESFVEYGANEQMIISLPLNNVRVVDEHRIRDLIAKYTT